MKIKEYIDYKYASKIYNEILTNSKTTNGIEYYYKPKYINSNILKYLKEMVKKDNDEISLNGIEFLVLSIFSLLIQYIPKLLKIDENTYMLAGTYIFLIYYGIKNIIIYTCERKKELDNLSDIKEIVKDEPIKKETKRKNKTEE